MATSYYIIKNGQQAGPFTKDNLKQNGLTPESLVWTTGMSNWQPASQVVDLADLFVEESAFGAYAELPPEQEPPKEREYFAMIAGNRVGPYPLSLLRQMGVTRDTPVWTAGMSNWQPAYSVAEVFAAISGTPNFSNSQGSPSPFQTSVHTNWLPWAIVATIAGFFVLMYRRCVWYNWYCQCK